jgi:YcaO-like protein with predicted kinase domain
MPYERERDFAQARSNALTLLAASGIRVKSWQVGENSWVVELDTPNAGGSPVTGSGKGVTPEEAEVGALFEAIEHMALTEHTLHPTVSCVPVEEVVNVPDWRDQLGVVAPLVSEQAGEVVTIATFSSLDGTKSLQSPLGLHCPHVIHDLEGGRRREQRCDTFDYRRLRKYSSSNGMAAGSTLAEALIHAVSEVVERQSVGEFLVRDLGSQSGSIRLVDPKTLPDGLRSLLARARDSAGTEVHLIDVTADAGIPTFVTYASHEDPNKCCMTMGASLYPEYAASRSLTELVQTCDVIDAELTRGGKTLSDRTRIMFDRFSQPLTLGYERFRPSRLTHLLRTARVRNVDFLVHPTQPSFGSLDEHVAELDRRLRSVDRELWYRIVRDWRPDHEAVCIQALITPFDPSFLLMHGVPVSFSPASVQRIRAA